MHSYTLQALWFVSLLSIGCTSTFAKPPHPIPTAVPPEDQTAINMPSGAKAKFDAALKAMALHDKTADWTQAHCASTARLFAASAAESGFASPSYNEGLVHARCNQPDKAKTAFQQALKRNPKLHSARVRLILLSLNDANDINAVIAELERITKETRYTEVEALISLATLQMQRANQVADGDGRNDLDRAKKNIHRALAIDDGFMPAYNQLALYYLAISQQGTSQSDAKSLELAALVCSQAIRKNPNYAPVHNTAGLVDVALGNLSGAAQSFATARKLDPSLFEAHLNYAAVNLQFRGFQEAEDAYRAALKLKPNDYDSHLGLALALRGQMSTPDETKMAEAFQHLIEAKKIAPNRPEVYYNQAILTQNFKASPPNDPDAPLREAKALLDTFLIKAQGTAQFADSIKRAKERQNDINQILIFNQQTKEEQRRIEEESKQRDAEATMNNE